MVNCFPLLQLKLGTYCQRQFVNVVCHLKTLAFMPFVVVEPLWPLTFRFPLKILCLTVTGGLRRCGNIWPAPRRQLGWWPLPFNKNSNPTDSTSLAWHISFNSSILYIFYILIHANRSSSDLMCISNVNPNRVKKFYK